MSKAQTVFTLRGISETPDSDDHDQLKSLIDLPDDNISDPQVAQVVARLKGILKDKKRYEKFLKIRDEAGLEAAQDVIDSLQKLLDHFAPESTNRRLLLYVALFRLCRRSKELYPRSFLISEVTKRSEHAQISGGYGDIYYAQYKNQAVCLKLVKIYQEGTSDEVFAATKSRLEKAFIREAVVWAQLSHANILPLYGIYGFNNTLSLVSPLASYRDVLDFLSKRPESDSRPKLLYGVAAAMEYLHQNGITHGDLKCSNVLVEKPDQALLADFGFSYVMDDNGLQGRALSSSHTIGHTKGFEAPELMDKPDKKNKQSDVFAFGMLCYQMFASPSVMNFQRIHLRIVDQQRLPEVTHIHQNRGLTDEIWGLMKACWSYDPKLRPTATKLRELLPEGENKLYKPRAGSGCKPGDIEIIMKALGHLQKL